MPELSPKGGKEAGLVEERWGARHSCKITMVRSSLVGLGEQRRLMLEGGWGPVHSSQCKELTLPLLLSCSFCTILWASLGRGLKDPPRLTQGLAPSHQVSPEASFLCAASPRSAAASTFPLLPHETVAQSWPYAAASAEHRVQCAAPRQKRGSQSGVGRALG